MIALSRDLVVLDCQPPSNTRTKSSPTSAILLPCKNTTDTPSMFSTRVFACPQSREEEMASFISRSILRMVGIRLNKCTIQEIGHRSSDAVPLVSLVGEHREVGVADVIYHVIRGRHVETIAEPIDCHLSRCHGVKHVHVQLFESIGLDCHGARINEFHAPIISMGFGDSLGSLCHLANWLPRPKRS